MTPVRSRSTASAPEDAARHHVEHRASVFTAAADVGRSGWRPTPTRTEARCSGRAAMAPSAKRSAPSMARKGLGPTAPNAKRARRRRHEPAKIDRGESTPRRRVIRPNAAPVATSWAGQVDRLNTIPAAHSAYVPAR